MDKNQREERRRQEDIALNRGLIWVGAAIVLELLLLLVNKYYINIYTTQESVNMAYAIGTGLKALQVIALVGMIACGVWIWQNLKKNVKAARPTVLLVVCGALAFCAHIIIAFNASGLRMLFLLVPAWAALALVYYLYQREFFCSAFFTGMGMVAMWLIRHMSGHTVSVYAFLAVMAIVLVAGFVVFNRVRGGHGHLTVFGNEVALLPEDANYRLMALTAGINVAAVAVALVMGGTAAYYLIYALLAWLFGLLVYYTVKIM